MKKLFLIALALIFISCSKKSDVTKTQQITVSFSQPSSDTLFNNDINTFSVKYSGTITKAEYYLNNLSIGVSIGSPFSISYTLKNVIPGNYPLTCIVTSDGGQTTTTKNIVVSLRLGDEFEGGKIFSLNTDKTSGLIASENDFTYSGKQIFIWGPASATGATDLNNGKANSTKILSLTSLITDTYWEGLLGYSINDYSDWYVPSYNEMTLLKQNMSYVGNFPTTDAAAVYWTSTETDATTAYGKNMLALMGEKGISKGYGYRVRLIRSF